MGTKRPEDILWTSCAHWVKALHTRQSDFKKLYKESDKGQKYNFIKFMVLHICQVLYVKSDCVFKNT